MSASDDIQEILIDKINSLRLELKEAKSKLEAFERMNQGESIRALTPAELMQKACYDMCGCEGCPFGRYANTGCPTPGYYWEGSCES
jgi:hypothetical protein